MASVRELALPYAVKLALAENHYQLVEELKDVSATDLKTELAVTLAEAEEIVRLVASFEDSGPSRPTQQQSSRASDLLSSAAETRFSTLSISLDTLIGHFSSIPPPHSTQRNMKGRDRSLVCAPITPGMVVELSGPPGGGKTCIALAIALSARLAGSSPPEVLLIDTEGSLSPQRIQQAAAALLALLPEAKDVTVEDIVAGIHLQRVATQVQMVAALHTLDEFLSQHPKIKLVVIDTLSFHFRQPSLDMGVRKRVMDLAKETIAKITTVRGCAVVVTNQLATKLLTSENKPATFETGDRAVLMPQLGDSWTTDRTVRVAVFRGTVDELRYAHASVSSTPGASGSTPGQADLPWAAFDIDSAGLPCDVPPLPSQQL